MCVSVYVQNSVNSSLSSIPQHQPFDFTLQIQPCLTLWGQLSGRLRLWTPVDESMEDSGNTHISRGQGRLFRLYTTPTLTGY